MVVFDALARQAAHPRGVWGAILLDLMSAMSRSLSCRVLGRLRLPSRAVVLDVGCGNGTVLRQFAADPAVAEVWGLDPSPAAMALSRRRNRHEVARGRIRLTQGALGEARLPDARFDLITAFETHYFWSDLPAAFRAASRALKPGGRLVLSASLTGVEAHPQALPPDGLFGPLFLEAGFAFSRTWREGGALVVEATR